MTTRTPSPPVLHRWHHHQRTGHGRGAHCRYCCCYQHDWCCFQLQQRPWRRVGGRLRHHDLRRALFLCAMHAPMRSAPPRSLVLSSRQAAIVDSSARCCCRKATGGALPAPTTNVTIVTTSPAFGAPMPAYGAPAAYPVVMPGAVPAPGGLPAGWTQCVRGSARGSAKKRASNAKHAPCSILPPFSQAKRRLGLRVVRRAEWRESVDAARAVRDH